MEQTKRCAWCGVRFAVEQKPGRPPKYCRPSHRQRHYEARREARLRGIGPDEVVFSRTHLDAWNDQRYVLETLLEDLDADLEAAGSADELRSSLKTLSEGVRTALDAFPDPVMGG